MPAKRGGARPRREQRSAVLSDEAWAALQERATLERKSASDLCEFLLRHYLSLEAKPTFELPEGLQKRTRSLYVSDRVWAGAKAQAVLQRRSVSALLEQLLRAYLGLKLGGQASS